MKKNLIFFWNWSQPLALFDKNHYVYYQNKIFSFEYVDFWLMYRSCHFNRASNNEFSLEFWVFVLIFFQPTLKSDLKEVQFPQNYLFCVKGPLLYLEGTLNLATVKKHNNNKYSNFNTKFVIWCPVKMTWTGHKSIFNFVSLPWKLDNPYYLNLESTLLFSRRLIAPKGIHYLGKQFNIIS